MSVQEAERLLVIRRVLGRELTQGLAAQQLGLSVRQVKRLCQGVRSQGVQAVVNKLRAPMATPNCSTYGRSNCSRQDRVDYDDSGLMAMRAAASLRR